MSTNSSNFRPLNNEELSAFCSQMTLILKAGISWTDGISIMIEESKEINERDLLKKILEEYETSLNFYQALQTVKVFPVYAVKMIKIGEETGNLDDVMAALASHYEREASVQRSIKNAFIYPSVIAAMLLVVIVVLLSKVMPLFNQVYISLGAQMTGIAGVLLSFGNALGRYSTVIIIAAVIIAAVLIISAVNEKSREKLFNLFSSKGSESELALSRFMEAFGICVKSGFDPVYSMGLAKELTQSKEFSAKVDKALSLIEENNSVSASLKNAGILSGMYAKFVSIGEKSGSLDDALLDISRQSSEALDVKLSNRLSALEPVIVVVLSVIVGVILLSVMLPLMSVMSTL